MKALSLTEPMAWAIFNGKDIENRRWATKVRGRVMIHASLKFDKDHAEWIWMREESLGCQLPSRSDMVFGAIIGEVDIVDCVEESESPWWMGPYGFVLENAVLYETPIPCKGSLGFFTPKLAVVT